MGVVVPLGQKGPAGASLRPLMKLVEADMERVNSLISKRTGSDVRMIPELANHLINSGGKRIRPMLTIATAQMFGYGGEHHVTLAASVEFMHTATLLHDDVVDESNMRRGKAAANIIFGNPATVLVGDFLFSRSFELMTEDGSLKVLKILSNASAVIAEGEVDQLTAQRKIETSEERYLHIIGAKTAALFAAASRIAAVVAECGEREEQALDDYGRNLGVAFQLVDDAIDYDSDAAEMGKDRGDDFREGKVTLPVILSYRRGSDKEREFWRRAIEQDRNGDEELEQACELIAKHDAIADTVARARHFGGIARDGLAPMGATPHKSALLEVIDFCVNRVN